MLVYSYDYLSRYLWAVKPLPIKVLLYLKEIQ